MTRWALHSTRHVVRHRHLPSRCFYSQNSHPQRVTVQCGMAGHVNIDLHNVDFTPTTSPLLVYLPPFYSSSETQPLPLPSFCRDLPTAVINYRWAGFSPWEDAEDFHPVSQSPSPSHISDKDGDSDSDSDSDSGYVSADPFSAHLKWPMPILDVSKALDWLYENLEPPLYKRRNVYVFGSYLGASLATSLAITENHPHERMAVRGCVAFNGVYNWSMFLDNHPIHKENRKTVFRLRRTVPGRSLTLSEDSGLQELGDHKKSLFRTPENMFDNFASPCLFFRSPGLLVPPTFNESDDASINRAVYAAALPAPSASSPPDDPNGLNSSSSQSEREEYERFVNLLAALKPMKPKAQRGLLFPPRSSTLKIPEALLLHTTPPPGPFQSLFIDAKDLPKNKIITINSFAHQAEELASCMRGSITRENKERMMWDENIDGLEYEPTLKVQVADVGPKTDFFELPQQGQDMVRAWLEDRMG